MIPAKLVFQTIVSASISTFIGMWGLILNIFSESYSFLDLVYRISCFWKKLEWLKRGERKVSFQCKGAWPRHLQGEAHSALLHFLKVFGCLLLLRALACHKQGLRGSQISFNTPYRYVQDVTLYSRFKYRLCDSFFIFTFFLFYKLSVKPMLLVLPCVWPQKLQTRWESRKRCLQFNCLPIICFKVLILCSFMK